VQKDQNKTALNANIELHEAPLPPELLISRKNRIFIILAALLALFLGALDALGKVMSFDLQQKIDLELFSQIQQNVENIFRPAIQILLSTDVQQAMQEAVGHSVMPMFCASLVSSIV
jgi:hypothetical protein